MKLLLDENISPKVAEELARVDGLDACHVRDRGLLAATDAEVLERAYDEDRVLVTANVGDFLRLARARDLHPGIVLLEDGASPRAEQLRLLRVAAAAIAQLASFSTRSSGLPLTARCALRTSLRPEAVGAASVVPLEARRTSCGGPRRRPTRRRPRT